jgi:hypothetical protein
MLSHKFSEIIFFHITHLYIYIHTHTLDYSVQKYVLDSYIYNIYIYINTSIQCSYTFISY